MASRTTLRALARACLLLALPLGACRGGCNRATPAAPPHPALAPLPARARFVASVDLARVRATPLWERVSALATADPRDTERLRGLTQRTGLDPLRQIHRIVAAFPDDASRSGQFALVIDGEGFDEARLVGYTRAELAARGGRIESRMQGARTLWFSPASPTTAAFFVGQRRFVLAAGGWAEEMAALADGKPGGAAGNHELAHLLSRLGPDRALWFAAVVPADLRQQLMADPKLTSAASVTRLAGAADLAPGLQAELVADLSNAADARALVTRIQTTLREAKSNAQVLMLGFGPYLDALIAQPDGPRLRVTLALSPTQTRDLVDRLGGLVRLARARRGR